jgi:hypothetical protein
MIWGFFTMSEPGRKMERQADGLVLAFQKLIKSALEKHNDGRPKAERVTHRMIDSKQFDEYPYERDIGWFSHRLRQGEPLTPATMREMLFRLAACGIRISRTELTNIGWRLEPKWRPYLIIPPGQGRQVAEFIATSLTERKATDPDAMQRLITELLEPYERVWSARIGATDSEKRSGSEMAGYNVGSLPAGATIGEWIIWLFSPIDIRELFDGRTMAIDGRPVRRGLLDQSLREMKLPKRWARKSC